MRIPKKRRGEKKNYYDRNEGSNFFMKVKMNFFGYARRVCVKSVEPNIIAAGEYVWKDHTLYD